MKSFIRQSSGAIGLITNMRKRIWITWENQRRNRTLSSALGAKLFQFDIKMNRLMRYPVALLKTFLTFIEEKPGIIFAQNPSLVLALFAVSYGRVFGVPVVIDSHNAGLFPSNGRSRLMNGIALHVIKNATLTLVTNDGLRNYVEQRGGAAFVLPDPMPTFEAPVSDRKEPLKGRHNVLFICSYASDEPYLEVVKAAGELKKDVVIYLTGNSKGRLGAVPENVVLTGYLPEKDYIHLLHQVDVIIDLTTREDCLVCGAYEAVAAGKPAILSDTKALRDYFSKGALYVDNTSGDLVKKINDSIANLEKLKKETEELKAERIASWTKRRLLLEKRLKDLDQNSRSN